jgi:hypothetical protein
MQISCHADWKRLEVVIDYVYGSIGNRAPYGRQLTPLLRSFIEAARGDDVAFSGAIMVMEPAVPTAQEEVQYGRRDPELFTGCYDVPKAGKRLR